MADAEPAARPSAAAAVRRRARVRAVVASIGALLGLATGSAGLPPATVRAQPGSAAPPTLQPIAHRGGGLRGLAVDGDTVYLGEGPDVVVLRAGVDGQLSEVRRVALPEAVFSLAIAPEADRLYAAANDGVFALSIADRERPTVLASVAVAVDSDSRLGASGEFAYARLRDVASDRSRCVVAVRFTGHAPTGEVGPPACAPGGSPNAHLFDRISVSGDRLALFAAESFGNLTPTVAVFDIADHLRPRLGLTIPGDDPSVAAVLASGRLWLVNDGVRGGTQVRSFDMTTLDGASVVADWRVPERYGHVAASDGMIWFRSEVVLDSVEALATGSMPLRERRWMSACAPFDFSDHFAVGAGWLANVNHWRMRVCRIPPDDRHASIEEDVVRWSLAAPRFVAAAAGRNFSLADNGTLLTGHLHRAPADLVREAHRTIPSSYIRSVVATDMRVVMALGGRLLAFDPALGSRAPLGDWAIPGDDGVTGVVDNRVAIAGETAVVLREDAFLVVDLAQPDRPAVRVASDWQWSKSVATDGATVFVAAGGRHHSISPPEAAIAPHVVAYDLSSTPPRPLGTVTIDDRLGWTPFGIAAAGSRLVVALFDGRHEAGEVVVIDAADPRHLAVAGRVRLEADGNVDLWAVAAAGDVAVVTGNVRAARGGPSEAMLPARRGAVWVVDIGSPAAPALRERRWVAGMPLDVAIDGRDVVVAAGEGGLHLFRLVAPDAPRPSVWRIGLPWLAPGGRAVRGMPVPIDG